MQVSRLRLILHEEDVACDEEGDELFISSTDLGEKEVISIGDDPSSSVSC